MLVQKQEERWPAVNLPVGNLGSLSRLLGLHKPLLVRVASQDSRNPEGTEPKRKDRSGNVRLRAVDSTQACKVGRASLAPFPNKSAPFSPAVQTTAPLCPFNFLSPQACDLKYEKC